MDQKTQRRFREILLEKRNAILTASARTRVHGQEVETAGAQDSADMAANSSAKDFYFSLKGAERGLLQQVDEALQRLDDKRFGLCRSCGESMEARRLLAVPWARHCLRCQEMHEQGLL
jgi:DnaK suppressor protein